MPPLRQAHVQGFYRPLIIGFVAAALLLIAGVIYASVGGTTIRVTPALSSITTSFSLAVGPDVAGDLTVIGTVVSETLSTTITAAPSTTGAELPDHATGTVTIKNTTGAAQPLAAGTRLQHENGVIVRTTTRLDVPARGQVEATAVADPLGAEGNVPVGRFTIVALRPANQSLIYGESTATFTGGLSRQAGSLSLEALTAASNQGEEELRAKFGLSTAGIIKTLVPISVATEPVSTTPAATYAVTVTMKGLTITYPEATLQRIIRDRLTTTLKDDQEISSIEIPTVTLESQPTSASATLAVTAAGLAQLRADSPLLAPAAFVGLNREVITKKLLGDALVSAVTVEFSPWWRSTAADDPAKISVLRLTP